VKKKIEKKEKTAGQIIEEHTANKKLDDVTPHELGEEMLARDFEKHMTAWVQEACKTFDGDFFIVLNLKVERSLNNAPHIIPEARQTCPDPFYDQSVWHYHRYEELLEYLWSIPDIGTTRLFKDDPLNCPSDQVQLRQFVLDYSDGTLQNKANRLNEDRQRSIDGRKRITVTGNA